MWRTVSPSNPHGVERVTETLDTVVWEPGCIVHFWSRSLRCSKKGFLKERSTLSTVFPVKGGNQLKKHRYFLLFFIFFASPEPFSIFKEPDELPGRGDCCFERVWSVLNNVLSANFSGKFLPAW